MKKIENKGLWIAKISVITFFISIIMSIFTSTTISEVSIPIAVIVLLIVIFIGILFDIVGMAVATADEVPFHAKSSRGLNGSRESLKLIKNSEKVSSFCNDVIGDISGVISGGLAASIVVNICKAYTFFNSILLNMLFTALVASLTVGGKAAGKKFAINSNLLIIEKVGIFLYYISKLFHFKIKKDKE